MKKKLVFWLGLGILMSCQNPTAEKDFKIREYFPIDSVLQSQMQLTIGKEIIKTVTIGDVTETATLQATNSFLEKEWNFLESYDINKPGFVGAMDVIQSGNMLRYQPKAGQKVFLDYIEYTFDQNNISSIKGSSLDDKAKSIYGSARKFNLLFEDGTLKEYSISGYQKIIMKDTVYFEVKGIVQ